MSYGVLYDTTKCIGCRACQVACKQWNQLPCEKTTNTGDLENPPKLSSKTFTKVRFTETEYEGKFHMVFTKIQCMHCKHPACAQACPVSALQKRPEGAVTYDDKRCFGCRYCMVACPFQVPAYEYRNSLTPKVRKCVFCFEKRLVQGGMPACIEACPMQVMTFGRRDEMVRLAKQKLRADPDRYFPHIYGEHEVGGTAWMYLSSTSFQKIDLPALGYHPVPGYTEPVQHMLFKWFLPPLGLYGLLGGIMWFVESRRGKDRAETEGEGADGSH